MHGSMNIKFSENIIFAECKTNHSDPANYLLFRILSVQFVIIIGEQSM